MVISKMLTPAAYGLASVEWYVVIGGAPAAPHLARETNRALGRELCKVSLVLLVSEKQTSRIFNREIKNVN